MRHQREASSDERPESGSRARGDADKQRARGGAPSIPRGHWFALGTGQIERLNKAELEGANEVVRDDDLAAIPYAAFVIDTGGRIEDVNALAEALVGYSRGELVGKLASVVVSHSKDTLCALPALDALDHSRFVPAATGLRARHRSGLEVPIEILLCPHDRRSTLAIVRSPSAAFRSPDALEQIVHDLKNPLGTIALEACLLDETLAGLSDRGPRTAVTRITRNISYLERMVHDLLDSCSIDAGRFEIQRRPTELRALLERVVDRVVATRDLGRVRVEAPAPLTLAVDELRIERVVANLVQNALKYAPRSSAIAVRLDVVAGGARISVSDAGPGMSTDETAVVFDKYRRALSARMQEGSGLGLYVSKQIVEAHGGTIGVDSVRGVGSRFFFELPAS